MTNKSAGQVAGTQDRSGYVPIEARCLRVATLTGFDLYIQTEPGQPLVLYRKAHLEFGEKDLRRLVDGRVNQLFISADQQGEYCDYVLGNLGDILADSSMSSEDKCRVVFSTGKSVTEEAVKNPEKPESVARSKSYVRDMVSYLEVDDNAFQTLLRSFPEDYATHTHCLNVTLYAVTLARQLDRTDTASLREMANGALLHDIGKAKIDDAVLMKAGPLTAAEWDIVKRHPVEGVSLLEATGRLGEIALDIVLHHHERFGGSGYPDGLEGQDISPFVRLVTIADVFDALTTQRAFQKALSSYDALNLMRGRLRNQIDQDFFEAFVSMMAGGRL